MSKTFSEIGQRERNLHQKKKTRKSYTIHSRKIPISISQNWFHKTFLAIYFLLSIESNNSFKTSKMGSYSIYFLKMNSCTKLLTFVKQILHTYHSQEYFQFIIVSRHLSVKRLEQNQLLVYSVFFSVLFSYENQVIGSVGHSALKFGNNAIGG